MGSPNSIEARMKNFSKTFFTPLPASCDEILKNKIHQVFNILYFFGKTTYNNHENTKEGKHEKFIHIKKMERSDTLTLAQNDYNYFIPKKVRFGMMRCPAKTY